MAAQDLIAKAEAFLKSKFDEGAYLSAHPDAKAYRLEHSYRIHEFLSAEGFLEKSIGDKKAFVAKKLEGLRRLKDVEMATETANELWRDRIAFYTAFYEKLEAQLSASCGII